MDRVLGSAVYIFPPSNLKSSHDIDSRGTWLAAFRERERERGGWGLGGGGGAVISGDRMWRGNTEEKAEFY